MSAESTGGRRIRRDSEPDFSALPTEHIPGSNRMFTLLWYYGVLGRVSSHIVLSSNHSMQPQRTQLTLKPEPVLGRQTVVSSDWDHRFRFARRRKSEPRRHRDTKVRRCVGLLTFFVFLSRYWFCSLAYGEMLRSTSRAFSVTHLLGCPFFSRLACIRP